ncbi:hypothetical protein BDN72DRAFT_849643 [Pluteus cervinus]|uniref:Uncharacterized protein n=1 Tax=Pluteus cervinus TaxID=181527 RepID=A0ACD3A6I9_9AGAR|nr:hypothetical protein BDN72DRAFT_849643 [Pluteus cervinus]
MNAHALPEELWTHIFKYLPHEALKTMGSVDSIFRTYVSSLIRRRLTVCSLLPENIKNAKLILGNPYLARQVTNLRLRPVNYVAADQVEAWTSLWLITAPTFWSVLKHFKWAHPVLSWRYYRRSIEDIRVSTKAIPLLTHLQEITVVPFFHRRSSYIPPIAPYRAIWAGLRTEHLQRLNLQLWTPGSMQMISEAMRSTPPAVFTSLRTLTLDVGVERNMYTELQEDLRTILDCGRPSLRSFGIAFCTGSHFADVVGAFGIFPNLSQFHFQASFLQHDENAQLLRQHLLPFFLKHKSTLTKLQFSMLPLSPTIIQSIFGRHDDNDNSALKLEAFTLRYHFPNPSRTEHEQPVRMPSFRMFADTLTCLTLVPIDYREGLYYDDVKVLLGSLRRSNRTIGLKRLWICLMSLSPELLDLMAGSLTNLEKLKAYHGILVGEKDQQTDNKEGFLEKMNSRFYPHWELRYLDIKSWTEHDRIPADYLKRIIPSLREVGTIDWEDVDLKIGPWF